MSDINVFIAFGAGFLSFISPCVLPLYPAFLSYITGMSVSELKDDNKMLNLKSILHTLFFLLGFSAVFIMMGFASLSISQFLIMYQDIIRQVGAIIIIFFGLVIVGVLNFDFLMKNKKITFKNRPAGFIGSFLIGLAFSLGWTPCTGPILGIVLTLAANNPDIGVLMMVSYILGFSVPFFVLSFFIGKLNWIKKYSTRLVKIGGYIMIVMGVALFFNWMTALTSYLAGLFGFSGF
ncbi:MAG: cytochrome c biogenesis CcdA family protein [Bacillota bacterium]|uniref:Sulfite exporter TauE/SafE family protein n=1 Tax=Virgibacillus salarius TaxID=447199 RepID=A0A941DUW9_9BACI|nr:MULTISPECIES: cytochrome c biogenesis protein CcdA [Bacillaceae]NAZ08884.1 cytochrome C biogenesis protein CcdA [Agaribacter marinus]MBR7796176.1 sulfite exporter TauE/SafE family protein [Virgibacillus salarius]MCC2249689.1 cytochrome c biogenesis protein CcdA [Virgibacillus sp. AGTR]MDY7042680.1 cytochrome c biogenesis protein CcdA [Virgibacillus sp. M23]QRZ17134.1 sulfite exporter TauE/SafE family protein [Virgibacillus sp. AGTR]